jgi:hypothetical protein
MHLQFCQCGYVGFLAYPVLCKRSKESLGSSFVPSPTFHSQPEFALKVSLVCYKLVFNGLCFTLCMASTKAWVHTYVITFLFIPGSLCICYTFQKQKSIRSKKSKKGFWMRIPRECQTPRNSVESMQQLSGLVFSSLSKCWHHSDWGYAYTFTRTSIGV